MAETNRENNLSTHDCNWEANDVPFSKRYGDVYFSRKDGLAETRYVFLSQNSLPEAWDKRDSFCISELGFGTGLNFAATLNLWKKTRKNSAKLEYVSFEKHPLSKQDILRTLSLWPELDEERDALAEHYSWRPEGSYLFDFPSHHASLILIIGDARETIREHHFRADCWFLDGFSPSKNPELWDAELFNEVARRSSSRATATTFSSARLVNDNLANSGFVVEKVPGFAGKRDMIRAKLRSGIMRAPKRTGRPIADVTIIGSGLAGSFLANRLTKEKLKVTLIERHDSFAQEASGNEQGILMPLLATKRDFRSDFSIAGFSYATQLVKSLEEESGQELIKQCGALRLSTNERLEKLISNFPSYSILPEFCKRLSPDEMLDRHGLATKHSALFFPEAAWVSPPLLCRTLLSQSTNLAFRYSSEAKTLQRKGDSWQVVTKDGRILGNSKIVILANANESLDFEQTSWLPITRVRGEIAKLKSGTWSKAIDSIVCHEGYILPLRNGFHLVGATFDRDSLDRSPSASAKRLLSNNLKTWLPDLEGMPPLESGRVSFRASSPDRLPIIGKLPNTENFRDSFLAYDTDRAGHTYEDEAFWPGLYSSLAHGSIGLTSCPISAEIITRDILGKPMPLGEKLLGAIHPIRFLVRDLKKQSKN